MTTNTILTHHLFQLMYSIFNYGDEYATYMIIVLSLHMNNNWVIMGILLIQTTVQLTIGSSPMMTFWVKNPPIQTIGECLGEQVVAEAGQYLHCCKHLNWFNIIQQYPTQNFNEESGKHDEGMQWWKQFKSYTRHSM